MSENEAQNVSDRGRLEGFEGLSEAISNFFGYFLAFLPPRFDLKS